VEQEVEITLKEKTKDEKKFEHAMKENNEVEERVKKYLK
jgi:hypothetical protein